MKTLFSDSLYVGTVSPIKLIIIIISIKILAGQHCIKNAKAGLSWRSIKSPGYPDFLQSQIQCSWM